MSAGAKQACFCVFKHVLVKSGDKGGEDGSKILENLVYSYPKSITPGETEDLLRVIISLYTFSTISLGRQLDFMSCTDSKVAIRTAPTGDESNVLCFVLRAPSVYSDSSVMRALEHIKRGLLFVLGDAMKNEESVKEYLEAEGERICATILPPESPDPLPFSFTHLPSAEWHRPSVTAVLTEAMVMRQYPSVWGIVCFVDDRMLVSYSPLEIIRLFDFVHPGEKRASVFLTNDDRRSLTDYKGCISKIPEMDLIPCTLLRFQHESVVFFLLVDPSLSQETYEEIHETLNRAMPDIATTNKEQTQPAQPANTIWYDRVLHLLRAGSATPEFQSNAIYAHDSFARDGQLRDMVLLNAKEFSVCMNILTVEYFTSLSGARATNIGDLYDEALRSDPSFIRFLQSLHIPQGQ